MSSYLPVLVRRGQRWERAYAAGDEKSARLKRFVRKGIPNRWVPGRHGWARTAVSQRRDSGQCHL